MWNRRSFLCASASVPLLAQLSGCQSQPDESAWDRAAQICKAIREPDIPNRQFLVEHFGAIADGKFDCTQAFAEAIAAAHNAGGGRVIAAAGCYRTGAIHLKSNVELHLPADAELSFIPEPKKYLPAVFTRWEGMEMMGYSPLIYAYGETNVALTGGGVLNGNADDETWWPWKGKHSEQHWKLIAGEDQKVARDALQRDVENGRDPLLRHYAEGSFLRPAFVQFYACQQVKIEGLTIINSPFWLLHPVLCESVTVRGVTCQSHGPNNDGCDPESCKNVLIENCTFNTGDDCIALKSGRNEDGRRLSVAIENVVVRNCRMLDGHGGLVVGSEISGGAKHIYMENCTMDSPALERALRFKTNYRRGGIIENVFVRNVHIARAQEVLVVNYHYEEADQGGYPPVVRNIVVENISADQVERVFHLRGFADDPIGAITLRQARFGRVNKPDIVEFAPALTLIDVVRN